MTTILLRGGLHASDDEQIQVRSLALEGETTAQTLIRLAQSTNSPISIIPLQDYLGLGEEARMNVQVKKVRIGHGNLLGKTSSSDASNKELIT